MAEYSERSEPPSQSVDWTIRVHELGLYAAPFTKIFAWRNLRISFHKLPGIIPAKRIQMRESKRILKLHFVEHLSNRAIARSVGISRASVSRLLDRAEVAQLTWPLPEQMTDAKLEAILYPSRVRDASIERPVPNWTEVRSELANHRSLTLYQLWKEYIEANPMGDQ